MTLRCALGCRRRRRLFLLLLAALSFLHLRSTARRSWIGSAQCLRSSQKRRYPPEGSSTSRRAAGGQLQLGGTQSAAAEDFAGLPGSPASRPGATPASWSSSRLRSSSWYAMATASPVSLICHAGFRISDSPRTMSHRRCLSAVARALQLGLSLAAPRPGPLAVLDVLADRGGCGHAVEGRVRSPRPGCIATPHAPVIQAFEGVWRRSSARASS